MKPNRWRPGFTLVELIVAMTIIVVLAVIAVPLSQLLSERDGVANGANITQGVFSLARARGLNDRKPTGVRLIARINQREIPVSRLPIPDRDGDGQITPRDLDIDGDGEATFKDLNPLNPLTLQPMNQPPGIIWDNNNNGFIDPGDLYYPLSGTPPPAGGGRGWSDGVDGDINRFIDDIAYCDQLEYIQDPGAMQDGWAWGIGGMGVPNPGPPPPVVFYNPQPYPLADHTPPPPPLRRVMFVPAFEPPGVGPNPNLPAGQIPPYWVPVAIPQTVQADTSGPFGAVAAIPYPNAFVIYGPFSQRWQEYNLATGNAGPVHPVPQRNFNFFDAFVRGEIRIGDFIELYSGGQVHRIIDILQPNHVSRFAPAPPDPHVLPAALVVDTSPMVVPPRPGAYGATPGSFLTTDVHVPRSFQSLPGFLTAGPNPNYRILRQPRLIAGERPVKLPANVVIDLKPEVWPAPGTYAFGNIPLNPSGPVGLRTLGLYPSLNDENYRFYDGLGTDQLLGNPEILFAPSGQVLGNLTAADKVRLWVRDTSQGNEDNEYLVTIDTREGTTAIFPVNRDPARVKTNGLINYFWHAERGRNQER